MGAAAVIVAICLIGGGIGGYTAIETGFVPIKDVLGFSTLEVKEPIGPNMTQLQINQLKEKYPEIDKLLNEIPHLYEIKYGVYETESPIQNVLNNYDSRLRAEGYTRLVNGSLYFMMPLFYWGYLKGATAVGIVMTDYALGHDTLVLYTTGPAGTYEHHIIPWLKSKYVGLS